MVKDRKQIDVDFQVWKEIKQIGLDQNKTLYQVVKDLVDYYKKKEGAK